ncbi:hypothetical protein Nepgr_009783 [Nepenthes gracilis]|uniref:Uncharacterized protein n=1 Tax=Nepenthes gracilis TaxID=150966 RepID=A0AAD3SB58_NEPGR|nr:hypothetical protein Nepgr_009783 [Nepenthes gracilis]
MKAEEAQGALAVAGVSCRQDVFGLRFPTPCHILACHLSNALRFLSIFLSANLVSCSFGRRRKGWKLQQIELSTARTLPRR